MMDENEIRRRFDEMRETDRVSGPSFAQTHAQARVRARRNGRASLRLRPLVMGAAAAVLVAVVVLARGRSLSPSAPAPTITTWTAPTDVFLRTPGSELLAEMPALGASVLDSMIPKPSHRGT